MENKIKTVTIVGPPSDLIDSWRKLAEERGIVLIDCDNNKDLTISTIISLLIKELRKDQSEGSYYYAWQANIAMAFYDSAPFTDVKQTDIIDESRPLSRQMVILEKGEVHKWANQAAKNFLDNLIREDGE